MLLRGAATPSSSGLSDSSRTGSALSDSAAQHVRSELARRSGTNPEEWFLTFKARYGMEVVFRQLAREHGTGTVVTQLLTCVTAVTPILSGGLVPHYAAISPDSLAINPQTLTMPPDARALVIQNTFGIFDRRETAALAARTRAAGALVVEDSAHCLTRLNRTADGEVLADVSVHSFGVEKMLPTKFGGAIWLSPQLLETKLGQRIAEDLRTLPQPGRRLNFAVRSYRNQLRVLNRLPGALARSLRRALIKLELFEPAVAPIEQTGTQLREPMAMSQAVLDQVTRALPQLDALTELRTAAVQTYIEHLREVLEVPYAIGDGQPLVRFPFLAPRELDADELIVRLNRAGVYAGRWYRPALFPGVSDPERYRINPDGPEDEVTADVIARIVNLPTDVSVERAAEIAQLLRAELTQQD